VKQKKLEKENKKMKFKAKTTILVDWLYGDKHLYRILKAENGIYTCFNFEKIHSNARS
jgi:hypothetical protein